MILWRLFVSFLQVGLFSVGGGYAAIPLIADQVVSAHGWLTMTEFTNLITIAEMTPGPIAVNSATFVGLRIAGLAGAVIATLGCITPSIVIVSLLAYVYQRWHNLTALQSVLACLRPAVVALIAAAGLSILKTALWGGNPVSLPDLDILNLILFIGAFLVIRFLKGNPILTMVSTGFLALLIRVVFGL